MKELHPQNHEQAHHAANRKLGWRRWVRPLASLRLAVLVILYIAVVSAWGTVVESQYNAEIAQKVVYHSIYMYVALGLLVVNLLAVIVDRYPWKRHHAGFILAHVGIIVLLFGAWQTKWRGVDGSMVFGIGESSDRVVLPQTDLMVYASFDGENMRKVYEQEVDLYLRPPTADQPLRIPLGAGEEIEIFEYVPFALLEQKVVESQKGAAQKAIRFQLQNSFTSVTEWLLGKTGEAQVFTLGPAQVVLADAEYQPSGQNEIVLTARGEDAGLSYVIYSRENKHKPRRGTIRPGEVIETPWMGMQFRLLKYWPRAERELSYKSVPYPRSNTTAVLRLRFGGVVETVPLDSVIRLYGANTGYYFGYRHRRLQLGFSLLLKDFKMGLYQGTRQAMSYESHVYVPEQGDVVISMNEPLKYRGFTFYQASFQADEQGKPTMSILSVNWDPGRWLKYLGSLLIVLGVIVMFYFRKLGYYQWGKKNEVI